jgi:PAS domain S-box-containing protein
MVVDLDVVRVLVVDPDAGADVRRGLEGQEGITVDRVETAETALEHLSNDGIDCVVATEVLGETNGLALCEAVRVRHDELPYILLARECSQRAIGEAFAAGVSDYVRSDVDTTDFDVLRNRIVREVQRSRAVDRAREAEARLNQLAENTTDVLFIFDGEWSELEFINSAYENLWGHSIESLRADPESFLEAVHPADRSRAEDSMAALMAGEQSTIEYRIRTADGETRCIEGESRPILGEDGNVERIVGIVHDVTDQKRRERELEAQRVERRRSEERLALALEAAQAGVWDWDVEEGSVVWDENVERLFGLEPGSFEGDFDGFIERVHPKDRENVARDLERAIEEGRQFACEFRISPDEGGERWILAMGDVLTDDAGNPSRFVGVDVDITERKERELHLRVIDRVLRHNLRNDLNVVSGHAETIAESADAPTARLARAIQSQSERLLQTAEKERAIVDLLSSEPAYETVALEDLVSDAAEWAGRHFPEATVEVEGPEPHRVRVTDRFGRALRELIENALRHGDVDPPRVIVRVESRGDRVAIQVIDDGPAIPEMVVGVLTGEGDIEPLYHGSGLGLWLVHWIVRRSGGELSFEETAVGGNEVTITLPVGMDPRPRPSAAESNEE